MVSPLKRQRDKLLAAGSAGLGTSVVVTAATIDSLHIRLVEFEQDKRQLKELVQIAEKVNHKRDVLIPKYKPVAEAYLEAGENYQNPIFTDLIIWLFDIGDLETAVSWLFKAIELDLPTPENFKTNSWAVVCARFVLLWSEEQLGKGRSVEPYFSQVLTKIESEWKLPEKQAAEWYKFAGYGLLLNEKGDPQPSYVGDLKRLEKAREFLVKAHELHSKIGVKTKIGQIDMRIRAIQEGKL